MMEAGSDGLRHRCDVVCYPDGRALFCTGTYQKEVGMLKRLIGLMVVPALLLGFVLVSACQPGADGEATEEALTATEADAGEPEDEGPSLYERLGGVYNIAAVVDNLIERLAADDALNANPAIAAARVPERFPGLKYNLTAMVCQATGGPCVYTGLSMKDSHATLNISEADWKLFEADCVATLDEFEVPEAEQQELFAIIGSTKADIVVAE